MGRRPTTNPRRGMVRAAITVVVLTAILIVVILVVSSLTAPSAKAPTNPPTPGPITPITAPTSTTPGKTPSTTTPRAVPSPTHKKKTLGSLIHDPPGVMALERVPSSSLLERAARWTEAGIAVRSHDRIAWFASLNRRTPIGRLQIRSLPGGQTLNVGPADSLVKPVWSADGRFLMYVTFSPSHRFPGVQWTLMQYDEHNHRLTRLARLPGVAMLPLGWWRTRPLFLMATGSDSSIYEVRSGRASFLDVLAPQTVTSAALSPTAHLIAFAAPTNCYNCTLDFFDLRTDTEWSGPSGGTNESQLAWSRDGRSVVTEINGRLATVLASPNARERLGGSVTLPNVWQHSVTASISQSGVRLLDQITGQSVFSPFRAGKV